MSARSRHPNPRHRRQHRTDHERKKAIEEDFEAPKQAWWKKAEKLAFKFLQTAALQRPIFRPRSSRHRAKSHTSVESNTSEASSYLDTKQGKVNGIAIRSKPVGGRGRGTKPVLSGPVPDCNKDLNASTLSDLEDESIARSYNTPARPRRKPTATRKCGTVDGAGDDDDGLPVDASSGRFDSGGSHGSNLKKVLSGLEIDHNGAFEDDTLSNSDEDTTGDSDEDYGGGQFNTSLSSYENSDHDNEEDSDSESWTSNTSEDQFENVSQAATSLRKVAKEGFGDISPKWREDGDVPLGSGQLHLSDDHRAEDVHTAIIRVHHMADAHGDNTSSESGDTSSDSEDEDLATDSSDGSSDTSSENEEEVDDGPGHDGRYTNTSIRTYPKKPEKVSTIVSVDPITPVIPSSPEWDAAGSEDSESDVFPSHGADEAENAGPHLSDLALLPAYLRPGSFVRRRSKDDHHPYIILHMEQDENGKTMFGASLCTSRPQLRKIREQYGEAGEMKKHYVYLGGMEANPKGFETGGITMPTDPEVEIQGVPMRLYTYVELGEYGRFGPDDLRSYTQDQRYLTPSSLEEVLNQWELHGCKKKESSWERPRRATGNAHERIFT
ncbi:hypothetical protein ACHAPU_000778 [Fusarium lateritium]